MIRSLAQTSLLFLILSVPLSGCRDDAIESGEELARSGGDFGKAKKIVTQVYTNYLPAPKNWKDARYARSLFLAAELARGGVTPYQMAVSTCDENQNLTGIGAPWHVAAAVQIRPKGPGGLMIFDPAFGMEPLMDTVWRVKLGLAEKSSGGKSFQYISMRFPGTESFLGFSAFDQEGRRNNVILAKLVRDKKCGSRIQLPESDISFENPIVNFAIRELEDACGALFGLYDSKFFGVGWSNDTQKKLAARFTETARWLKITGRMPKGDNERFCCERRFDDGGEPKGGSLNPQCN